ncbi:MAG: DUF5683 domain-containing protein [Bacteroidota bacterium]
MKPELIIVRFLFLGLAVSLANASAFSQQVKPDNAKLLSDTSKIKPHSATRAAIYSAVLPGLGQTYNKKYWKIPVVYAGFATFGYFVVSNNKEYTKFKNAYEYKNGDTNPDKFNEYVNKYTVEELQSGRDFYRRNRDLSIILTSFWYFLGIVDASVDAYMFDYNVTDDISLKVMPNFNPISAQTPVPAELKLTFKLGSH